MDFFVLVLEARFSELVEEREGSSLDSTSETMGRTRTRCVCACLARKVGRGGCGGGMKQEVGTVYCMDNNLASAIAITRSVESQHKVGAFERTLTYHLPVES